MTTSVLRILENVKCDGQFFEISFSNFDAVVHILFKISLTVTDKLNEDKFLRDSWFEYKGVFLIDVIFGVAVVVA